VADRKEIRLSFSLGSALYAVRSDLNDLHARSDEPQEVGSQFISVFGQLHESIRCASSNRAAAAELRRGLIQQLGSCTFADKVENKLRNKLVASLRVEDAAPVANPFRVIYRYAAESTKMWFGSDWPSYVRCVFEVIGDPPFPGSRFWLNAYTFLDPNNALAPPLVYLRIHPNRLNVETYSAIYAVLVHECFCHVPAYRVKQRNDSVFSEGFCDWAAHELFQRWLRRLDPLLEDAARKFGEEIWGLMTRKEGGNKFWETRSIGHRAADRLVRMFIDAGSTDPEAIDLVIKLARELVVVQEPLIRKDAFVLNMGQGIGPPLKAQLASWQDGHADAVSVLP
jgi:hypothetical protein